MDKNTAIFEGEQEFFDITVLHSLVIIDRYEWH